MAIVPAHFAQCARRSNHDEILDRVRVDLVIEPVHDRCRVCVFLLLVAANRPVIASGLSDQAFFGLFIMGMIRRGYDKLESRH